MLALRGQQKCFRNLFKALFSDKPANKKAEIIKTDNGENLESLSRVWSKKQLPKSIAMRGARFETVDLNKQPNPKPAIDLISKYPIVQVHEHIVACDGGGGSLGHPKIYINLVKFTFLFKLLTPIRTRNNR